MKTYKGYMIDLDGTIFRGNEVIEGAQEFIDALYEKNIPYLFLTNNASSTQEEIANKLTRMGIKATPENIFTSSLATAKYIKQVKQEASCFVIGETGIISCLANEGLTIADENCDFVVMGIDRQINYEKLAKACIAIRNGARFISTNSDIAIPTEKGFLPGNGALTSVVAVSTGIQPTFIGKPEKIIMEEALAVLGLAKDDTMMIGDNYDTDILAGLSANVDTLLVFTGITSKQDHEQRDRQATHYVDSLTEWIPHL